MGVTKISMKFLGGNDKPFRTDECGVEIFLTDEPRIEFSRVLAIGESSEIGLYEVS